VRPDELPELREGLPDDPLPIELLLPADEPEWLSPELRDGEWL
jgi:hypothetical protein